jgi:exosortase
MTTSQASCRLKSHNDYIIVYYLCAVLAGSLWLFGPLFRWLVETWRTSYQDTFGYIAPLVSTWVAVRERKAILSEQVSHSSSGWAFFLPGLALAVFAHIREHHLGACIALPFFCYGLCLLIWGKARSHRLLFPFFLNFFLYPWDTIIESTSGFQLRLLSTWMAFWCLKILGIANSISGTIIETGRFSIDVASGCSGLIMLKVLFFAGAIAAYLCEASFQRKCLLWASTIPLAMLLNMLRIVSAGLFGYLVNETYVSLFHDISGLLFYGIGLLFLYWETALLEKV